jgi:alpha-N-arabinofuranosidase
VASGANGADTNWTEVMMREAGRQIDGIGLHYYTVPTGGKGGDRPRISPKPTTPAPWPRHGAWRTC